MSPGPKECITDIYKRSPFDSPGQKKTDKYYPGGLIEIVRRNTPINASLMYRLFLHRMTFTGKKNHVMALGNKICCRSGKRTLKSC